MRIAGVDVGKVSSVAREGNAGLVTMEIEPAGLPIHSDATVKIRPRTFLEGNWFVELQPGSPSATTLSSGATLPITQTSDPVQLDQVLDALNTDTRANLQNFLIGFGDGFTRKPNAAENAEQDPELHGLNGAQALNKAYQDGPASLRGGAVLNQAITGTDPHDLSKLVASIGKVTAALNVHEQQLGELIVNFNAFFRSFASQAAALRLTVAELPSSLRAIDRGFAALGAALPPTRTFAIDILPGVKATPASIAAQLPWIEQVQASLSPAELGGVAKGLEEAAPWIARLQSEQMPVYNEAEPVQQMPDEPDLPGGQHEAPGRREHLGRRRLQGVLVLAGGPELDRPGLRRQRHDGPLPAVEQRPDAALGAGVDPQHRTCRGCACSRTRRCPRWAPARHIRPKSRRISRKCPATRRRCPTSTARSRTARPTGAGER